jgi:zinc/manganese transport system substrate-binding protein
MRTVLTQAAVAATALFALAACSDDPKADDGVARIVVTTSILGDVVENLVGDAAEVEVIMPPGSDPHDFAPSAKQAKALRDADILVVNGLGFEAGLVDTIEAAEADGVRVVTATDAVEVLPLGEVGHEEEEDAAAKEEHEDGDDPHFFTDPRRMRDAATHIAAELAEHVDGLDAPAVDERVEQYLADLDALDAEVERILAVVPPERRTLVTNHEVFGYFADRYDFEVLGAIIPGGTTLAEPSAADLADLAHEIAEAGVPAIFAETSAPSRLADALAAEGTDVEVVELFSESLGETDSEGGTYVAMMRTNAARIAAALG